MKKLMSLVVILTMSFCITTTVLAKDMNQNPDQTMNNETLKGYVNEKYIRTYLENTNQRGMFRHCIQFSNRQGESIGEYCASSNNFASSFITYHSDYIDIPPNIYAVYSSHTLLGGNAQTIYIYTNVNH